MLEVIRVHGYSDGHFRTDCRFEIERAGRIAAPRSFFVEKRSMPWPWELPFERGLLL